MTIDKTGNLLARIAALETSLGVTDARKETHFLSCLSHLEDCTQVDGCAFFGPIPAHLNGYTITGVKASSDVAGVTGTMTYSLYNLTQAAAILSTVGTFADGARVTTGEVIDAAEDDLTTGDYLRVDIKTVHSGTAAKGFKVALTLTPPA